MGNIISRSTHDEECPEHGKNKRKITHEDNDNGDAKRLRSDSPLPNSENKISEQRAGMTAFVNPTLVGFQCIIKYRQEDFLVNEVDLEGNVVRLTSQEKPVIDNQIEKTVLEPTDFDARVTAILGSNFASELRQLLDNAEDKERTVKITTNKSNREKFYRLIERHLDETLASSCKEGELIVGWPQENHETRQVYVDFNLLGEYLQFHVYKSGIDTMGAVGLISAATKIPRKRIGYAGTKDARAITVQAMTMQRIYPDDLFNAQESLKERGIHIGNFSFCKSGLVLGDLSGNRFNIVLRDVTGATEQDITKSLESLRDHGFLNYFGMQRFGTSTVMTHEVGRELMKKNYEAAVDLILNPREGDRKDFDIARKLWKDTGDAQLALDKFPKRASSERTLLASYVRFPGDHKKAIQSLPRNMASMYSHAYQSYIWNRVVSERAKRFGCSGPIVGDLVMVDQSQGRGKAPGNNKGRRAPGSRQVPKILTEDDVNNYSMVDVVYPLPGKKTVYPNNEMGELYKQLLEEDGISREEGHFEDLNGDYRAMLAKPGALSWDFIRYDDPSIKLCNTDVDRLNGEAEPVNVAEGKHLALRVGLNLATSQYATMALREIIRMDTSAKHQSAISHA
ncbi:multisubstrate pseudouridine synthase 7 [Apophysomyces sp. BC1034]|nr:multisubstrate pseudouridine synthase 7 [Apophysomyces sp. BC1015]KAG0182340.1 multisubstrate pseudouridine synthase 7 [Apophysomyces sp. BC1021]KAG0194539.1 multisubstrate pseudouridine synthase 7 [Apophysomyces sp. BC1034]